MPTPSPAPAGRWRVNIDVQHGAVTAHPGLPPGRLIADMLGDGVPTAVIDLDRSTGTSSSTALLESAVRHHPGHLWAGGPLTPDDPAAARLLQAGAAGVLLDGLTDLLHAARFITDLQFGGYDGQFLTPDSTRHLVMAHRP